MQNDLKGKKCMIYEFKTSHIKITKLITCFSVHIYSCESMERRINAYIPELRTVAIHKMYPIVAVTLWVQKCFSILIVRLHLYINHPFIITMSHAILTHTNTHTQFDMIYCPISFTIQQLRAESEISQFNPILRYQQNIFGFYVSVYKSKVVLKKTLEFMTWLTSY